MWLECLIAGAVLSASSGVPTLLVRPRSPTADRLAATLAVSGCLLSLAAAFATLASGSAETLHFPGPLPQLALHLKLDPLAAFFLVPISLVGSLASIYGLSYFSPRRHPRTAGKLRLFFGLLLAAMTLLVTAADALAFLFCWEVMALSAFFLVATEDHKPDAREAAWLYLVSTHVATLALFALFALFRHAAGTFDFVHLTQSQAGPGLSSILFLLALLAFGFKAGMMPFHFWLPSAHASAPSHVSAILSGVVLKMGIYGLLRTLTLLPAPPVAWGSLILLLGTLSAILGVVFALGQHDLKRLLAYHSIENIGIILMGAGLALLGEARGRPEWIVLGMAGCLLHVWNHAIFKSLLFLAAGSVVHSARTRDIDLMGGLAKPMPRTALLFLVGAIAICGLPPLNGFISELFIYLGLFQTLQRSSPAALAAPGLALVGALAVACFVKAFGGVFLGLPRRQARQHPHESAPSMLLPMTVLAGCCAAIGLVPLLVVRPLDAAIRAWNTRGEATMPRLESLAPVGTITQIGVVLGLLLAGVYLVSQLRLGQRFRRQAGTWDCGYSRPDRRMEYTASSFAGTLVLLFRGVLRPQVHQPRIRTPFPGHSEFQSHVDDVVLEGVLTPLWSRFRARLGGMRVLQHGSVQSYVLYILIAVGVLILLAIPLKVTLKALFGWEIPT